MGIYVIGKENVTKYPVKDAHCNEQSLVGPVGLVVRNWIPSTMCSDFSSPRMELLPLPKRKLLETKVYQSAVMVHYRPNIVSSG
jgi:hypothetical protein